ncbi:MULTISPECIES: hypothetical protein [Sphingobacterium]|uniref:FAD-dependent oxidoreductase n=1 Tax=Sphingobacterium populi TaxID=1812824 RepID=A0ABW5UD40_9SPHI|nr:hypothetical protein [Sphingobacterium sp. CFCC 11742]
MTKVGLFLLFLLLFPFLLLAQRKSKPTLLVYGGGVEAYAAAVQAALSNVPTLWVIPHEAQATMNQDEDWLLTKNYSLDGGIWMKLLMEMADHKTPSDSVAVEIKKHIAAGQLWIAAERIAAKLPNLTLVENTTIKKISLGKRGWQVQLNDRKRYDFRAVIDASTKQELVIRIPEQDRGQAQTGQAGFLESATQNLPRTTLAIGEDHGKIYSLTAPELFGSVKNNFFSLQALSAFEPSAGNIPLRMHYAQAIGATAAYVTFFKTTIDKIDLRKLQSELLTYHSRLLPVLDVATENPHFKSIQKIYLTGLFAIEQNMFDPQREVLYAEIRTVLNALYSRSQLWFMEHDGEELLWKDAIELVTFLATRGQEVNRQITEDWQKKFHFEGEYDPASAITRGEFAVILDQFADPYGIAITQAGEIRR